ncbi:hypothetical protein F5Y15DRAFT_406268 [Xylariaceae sp. FL0016]|nr:hypothetical protein F5Y15DRAFT_406268 [Xylariaceae sp. FL0016]
MKPTAPSFVPSDGQRLECVQVPYRPSNDSRAKIACRFDQKGSCRNGASCPFLHLERRPTVDLPTASLAARPPSSTVSRSETTTRVLRGVLVCFGSGGAVTKVSFPADYSAVHIEGLPENSSPATVLELLASHGIVTSKVDHLRLTPLPSKSSMNADIKVEDPEFAKSKSTSQPIATQVEPFLYSDTSALRVDRKKVFFSWHKPVKTVWLNFGGHDIAARVNRKFADGVYTIKGQKVQTQALPRAAGMFNRRAWTVCLTEVPAVASSGDIEGAIRTPYDKPRAIELGKPSYDLDPQTCFSTILSLFSNIGALEFHEMTLDPSGKRMKGKVRYLDADHAKQAENELNNQPLSFNRGARLTVQLIHSAKFKVSRQIYNVIQPQLVANIRNWKSKHLSYTAYDTASQSNEDVAAAKNGPLMLWHPMLRSNGPLFKKLEIIARQNGVHIERNKSKSQIRLSIAKLLRESDTQSHEIELDPAMLERGWHGGFKRISDTLGHPKRVIISGSAIDHANAIDILSGKEATLSPSRLSVSDDECSICYTQEPNAIITSCAHTYCLDCFENLCKSATAQGSAAVVTCVGDMDRCGSTLNLPELQDHLSSAAFEDLLEQSFVSYIRCHPAQLKHCPTPDCDSVYRVNMTTSPKSYHCPSCLVDVCTACQMQHGRMTCAEYKDISTGGYAAYERVKRDLNIKDCPRCGIAMEKLEGCNHMSCRCGAHICWVCMKTFDSSAPCYDHMSKVHRGIGLDNLQYQFGH